MDFNDVLKTTKSEAIKRIKDIISCTSAHIPITNKDFDALDLAVKALEAQGWIPVKTRELTAEEIEELVRQHDKSEHWCYCCPLPDDEQDVLITTKWGDVYPCTFCVDYDFGCYFEGYEDRDDVLAWMPLPEPYTKEETK